MPFESLHSELYEKSYSRFAKTAQDRPKLCTIVFELNFKGCVLVIAFYAMNESIVRPPRLFILGFCSLIGG